MPACPACDHEVLDIDVKCGACGRPLGTTGAHQLVGTIVLGQYQIVDVLGQGGMSVVYKARHKITEQPVALKLLPPELAAHSQVKSRFLEEARALAQLDHPNIVHLYNFGAENGAFCLAMQFVEGETWERMIMTRGRQEWPVAVRITIDVLRALEYAHGRGIVHRDMKPSNVLVRTSDGRATVMDFGIAKMTTSTRLTATGQTMGTVRYMSPEQVRGQEVDLRTDLYSLGATLYEALVGDTPFDGTTHFEIMTKHLSEPPRPPSALGVEVPARLEAALMRALAKKPDDRWSTARDLRKALEQVLESANLGLAETQRLARESVSPVKHAVAQTSAPRQDAATGLADRLEPATEAPAPPRRARSWLWLGLGGLVAAAGAGVALLMLGGDDDAAAPARDVGGGSVVSKAPAAFLPPDLPILTSQQDGAVTVHLATDWSPAEVIHVWTAVRRRFERAAADAGVAAPLPEPLSIVVVPARVLCDARTFESGAAPDDCRELGHYYRPGEQTLLVADDRGALDRNLGVGLAELVCVHQGDRVCDLVDPFAEQLRR